METAMTTTQPTKQQVREWQNWRKHSHLPPATPDEIRRQLGWGLVRVSGR
jgi:hypothetical protein